MKTLRGSARVLLIAVLYQCGCADRTGLSGCDGLHMQATEDVAVLLQASRSLTSAESREKANVTSAVASDAHHTFNADLGSRSKVLDSGFWPVWGLQASRSLTFAESREKANVTSAVASDAHHTFNADLGSRSKVLDSGFWLVWGPLLGILSLVILIIFEMCYASFSGKDADSLPDSSAHEVEQRENDAPEEDAYYLAMGSLIHDMRVVLYPKSQAMKSAYAVRLMTSLIVVCFLVALQVVVIYQVQLLVTSTTVSEIRSDYDKFEFHMYGSQESHTYLNGNGKHRGYPEFFHPELFDSLDEDVKKGACNIPFSQLKFVCTILLIWTLTCVFQMKRAVELVGYVATIPTVASMKEAMEEGEDAFQVVVGLTVGMKILLIPLLFLPWLGMVGYLLWLGCRWLVSSNDFGETVGNAVALEFILNLKDLLYYVLVPDKSKRQLMKVQFSPLTREHVTTVSGYLGNFSWGAISVLWVWVYIMHLQTVLPEYKWDVHDVCTDYYAEMLAQPDK